MTDNYYYLIKSEYLNKEAIKDVFAERGNWYEYNGKSEVNFFFTDKKNFDNNKLDEIKADITNVIFNSNRFSKNMLYDIFMKYDKNICKKFMAKQYKITYPKNYRNIKKNIFEKKIWILVSAQTDGEKKKFVVKNYSDYINVFQQKPIINEWLLVEYFKNPLLVFNKKFYIRLYFLITNEEFYYQSNGFIITTSQIHKNISDICGLFFPDGIAKDKIEYIRNQIAELCFHISKMSKKIKCHSNNNNCFEIFGIDILILSNYSIKIINISIKSNCSTDYFFTKKYLNGILETVVDNKYTPFNNIKNTNYFTRVSRLNFYTITDHNSKVWYTYSIYTDEDNLEEYVDNLFNRRGNWKKVIHQNASFIYLYLGGYEKHKLLWKYNSYIKNVVQRTEYQIINKSTLYNLFKSYDPLLCDKYMMKQYDVDINNYTTISRHEFLKGKIWILKPVFSCKGKNIHVFNDYDSYINYMNGETQKKIMDQTIKCKRKWVLAKYIYDPLLFQNRKFHFRVPYIYYKKQGYVANYYIIVTAGAEYQHGDYDNKYIHDTHMLNSIKNLLFPRDFDSNNINKIKNGVNDLMHIVTKIAQSTEQFQCYADATTCFEVFGVDIMLTSNCEVKLLEINRNASFGFLIPNIIEGVIYTLVDKIFPPENTIGSSDFFVNVTENNTPFYDKYVEHKNKYLRLKKFQDNLNRINDGKNMSKLLSLD